MASAILNVWVRAEPQQRGDHLEASCTGCEMQKCSSGKAARREGRLTLHRVGHELNQLFAAGLHKPRQQSNKNRWTCRKLRCECEGFMIMANGNCADGVIQSALLGPTRSQVLMLRLGSLPPHNISGTMQEELTKSLPRPIVEWSCIKRRRHLLQPGAPLGGANLETRVRLAQAQPPTVLGLFFIAAQELNEESRELFGGAPEALAWEQGTKNGLLADTRIKLRRQPPATCFAAQRFQQCCAPMHEQIVSCSLPAALLHPWFCCVGTIWVRCGSTAFRLLNVSGLFWWS